MRYFTLLSIASIVGLLATPSFAGVLTLDNPNVTVIRPISGSIVIDFAGVFSLNDNETNFSRGGFSVLLPYTSDLSAHLDPTRVATDSQLDDANWGKTFTGVFFTITINQLTDLALYNRAFARTEPSSLNILIGRGGQTGLVTAYYSVNVIESTPVPEPAFLHLLAIGLGAVCLVGWRRK